MRRSCAFVEGSGALVAWALRRAPGDGQSRGVKQPLASLSAVLLIVGAPAAFVRGASAGVETPTVAVAKAPVAAAKG